MSYYNTTGETGDTLKDSTKKAETQKERVLGCYKRFRHTIFPPSEVHKLIGSNSPLTSTRRAISDLTREGILEKTETKLPGIYGKPEYCWRLKQEQGQTTLF